MAVDKIDVALISGVAEKEPQLYEILKKTVEKVNGVVEQTNTDVTAAANSGPGDPAGTIKMFSGVLAPSGYVLCDGTAYKRLDQPSLFEATTIAFSGLITSGSPTITGIIAADIGCVSPGRMTLRANMPIQGFGIPSGTTITNVVFSGTNLDLLTVTMSANATATPSGNKGPLRAFPYGVPGGAAEYTDFYVPDLQQRFPLGPSYAAFGAGRTLGESGGTWNHTHTGGSHTHTVAAHGHTLSAHTHAGPSHTHTIDHSHTAYQDEWSTEGPIGFSGVTAGADFNAATEFHTHLLPAADETISHSGASGASGTGNTGAPSTDATSNTSLTTDAGGAVATTSANPPYVVVNFIIKT